MEANSWFQIIGQNVLKKESHEWDSNLGPFVWVECGLGARIVWQLLREVHRVPEVEDADGPDSGRQGQLGGTPC